MLQEIDRESFTIEVEVTPCCNYSCSYCENRKDKAFEEMSLFNIDFDALLYFIRFVSESSNFKNILVVLNGGEPTLHPGLLDFCKKASSIDGIEVKLLTNLSAELSLYEKMSQLPRVSIYPTYHESQAIAREFSEKMKQLKINRMLATARDYDGFKKAKDNFPEIDVECCLLEDQAYGEKELSALASMDSNARMQAEIFKNARKPHRICTICKNYIYVNGDGKIMKCMFNTVLPSIGDIKDKSSFQNALQQKSILCHNPYCFYR